MCCKKLKTIYFISNIIIIKMPNPIEEALKSLNESIALLDETKDLIGHETYLAMKNNLLSVCKNINRATEGVNDHKDDDADDDDDDDDNDNMSFTMPFTLVVTHKTSFDKVFDIAAALWRKKDKSEEIKCSFRNQSSHWSETSEKIRAYSSEQARRQGIDPTDTDVLNFNHYIRLAKIYWCRLEKRWYRADATFNLVGEIDYDGNITYD
jgi:hypothetical protein